MKTLIALLSGNKTYIVGALTILLGLIQKDSGRMLEGLSIITLRAGVQKAENATKTSS